MKRKKFSFTFISLAVFTVLVFYLPIIHFPVTMPEKLTGMDFRAGYLPFKETKKYATIVSCGRNCVQIKYHYKNDNEHLSILASEKASSSSEPIWQNENQVDGTKYFHIKKQESQMLAWIDNEHEVEFFLEHEGKKVDTATLIKVAQSLKE